MNYEQIIHKCIFANDDYESTFKGFNQVLKPLQFRELPALKSCVINCAYPKIPFVDRARALDQVLATILRL